MYWACCGKSLCKGCCEEHVRALRVTNRKRDKKKLSPLVLTCAFCRIPLHKNNAELIGRLEKRIEKDDTRAMIHLAGKYRDGDNGLRIDEAKAFELLQMAAGLGFAEAFVELGCGVAKKGLSSTHNRRKAKVYFEEAAKRGYVHSRHNLGHLLAGEGNSELAIKHWHLAAAAGNDSSMKNLWKYFNMSKLSKPDLEKALRAHKASSDEMNSEERERFAAAKEAKAGNDILLKRIYATYYDGFINAKELKKAIKALKAGARREVETFLNSKVCTNR